jgi:hypothetical protein
MDIAVLRVSYWPTPERPTTVALAVDDMKMPPTEAVEKFLKDQVGFFTWEVFDAEADAWPEAMIQAAQRANEEHVREQNMAILYYYNGALLRTLTDNGIMASRRAAPFNAVDAAWVLRHLQLHPDYRNQVIYVPLESGEVTSLMNGEITTRSQED